jgi:hypothetical protein
MPDETPESLADIGRRVSETIGLHIAAGSVGRWAAFRLADGTSDGIPYDTRADAIRHQLHESLCCYVKIPPDGMPAYDALRFVLINRAVYAAGFRLTDPDDDREPILPMTNEEIDAALAAFRKAIL